MRRFRFPVTMLLFIALASLALVLGGLSLLTGERGQRIDLSSGRIESYVKLYDREIYKAERPSPLYDAYKQFIGLPATATAGSAAAGSTASAATAQTTPPHAASPLATPPGVATRNGLNGSPRSSASSSELVFDWRPLLTGVGINRSEKPVGLRESLTPGAAQVLADVVLDRSAVYKLPKGNNLTLECRKQLILRGLELLRDPDGWVHFPGFMKDVERRLNAAKLPATELDLPTVQQFLRPQVTGLNFPLYIPPPAGSDISGLLMDLERQYRQQMQQRGYQALPQDGAGQLYRDPLSGEWRDLQGWDEFGGLLAPQSIPMEPGMQYAY